jgi:hypothetical protein
MSENEGWHVSLYTPTRRALKYNGEDPVRFKNLLRKAEGLLVENGMKKTEANEFLQPGYSMLIDQSFWQNLSDGLAVFIGEKRQIRYFRLPLQFESMVHVGQHNHVKPLVPLFVEDGRFYVLALSQGSIRFLQGTRYNVSEIDLVGVTQSLKEAMKLEMYTHLARHQHTASGVAGARGQVSFHGQGIGMDDRKDEILRYFQQVDKGLHEYLRSEKAPLLLAGVEYLFPIYRAANTYPYLIPEAVKGNPELLSAEELHAEAWDMVKPYFQQEQREAFAVFNHLYATKRGLVSTDLKEIIPAAYTGRVSALFVNNGVQQWGKYNPCTNTTEFHEKEIPGDDDLLNLAIAQTVLNDGRVYAMNTTRTMPDGTPIAAVLRY